MVCVALMLFCELCQLRRPLVKISVVPAVGTAKQLDPLPQHLSQAKPFVLAVSELQPVSPFTYILDFKVQFLLFLYPYLCIQIMNCSVTSLGNRITGDLINSRWLKQAQCVPWDSCGEGELQAVQALWEIMEWGWPQSRVLHFWIIIFEKEIFLHCVIG